MEVTIAIDRGNSSDKIFAVKSDGEVVLSRRTTDSIYVLDSISQEYDIKGVIMSSVHSSDIELEAFLRRRKIKLLELTHLTPMPITIIYRTPHTLGRDRIAAAVEAYCQAEANKAIVIDAGTAITLDYVSESGEYQGGRISPGLSLRLKSLEVGTQCLPLVEKEGDVPELGYDTVTSIRTGVVSGVCAEIVEFVHAMESDGKNARIFLTGGDAKFIYNELSKPPYHKDIADRIICCDNMVALGLNRILEYNHKNENS